MNSTVLVPVRNNARWAQSVADVVTDVEDADTEAIVLHVFDDDEVASTRSNLNDGSLGMDDLASRKVGVSAAVGDLSNAGFDATPNGIHEDDRPADAILNVVTSVGADRIYLYGRKRSPAGKAVFGSTAQRVVLNADVPVTIVPAGVD